MALKSPQLILFTLLSMTLVLKASAALGGRVGGWTPIPNTNDATVVEIAKFAVSEYNKESKGVLTYVKVVKGESQVVAGTNYRLTIKVTSEGSDSGIYEAVVWDKPWEHFRQLTSFRKV